MSLFSSDPQLITLSDITTDGTNFYLSGSNGVGSGFDSQEIFRLDISGGTATVFSAANNPLGIATDGTYVYWIDPSGDPDATAIFRVPIAGGAREKVYSGFATGQPIFDGSGLEFVPGSGSPGTLVSADELGGLVHRMTATNPVSDLVQVGPNRYSYSLSVEHFNSLTVAGGMIYVADSGFNSTDARPRVQSIPLSGGTFTTLYDGVMPSTFSPRGIAVVNDTVYVTNGNQILQMPAGGGLPTVLMTDAQFGALQGLTYFNNALYVADNHTGFACVWKVEFPNQPPVAADNGYTLTENDTLTVAAPGVLGNDHDPDGDQLTASLVSGVGHGRLSLHSDGSFEYTPALDYAGPDSFTYQASDGKAMSNVVTVALTVDPLPAPALQFSSAYFAALESTGGINITVTRTGDTSGAATIHYATSDITAKAGVDYVAASGTLTFVPHESSKTFRVTISDDGAVEGEERVRLTLSNAANAALNGPSQAVLAITESAGATPNERFVAAIYGDLLGREADTPGLENFRSALDQVTLNRDQVVRALTQSAEFRANEVDRLYRDLLNRPADPAGKESWSQFLAQGGTMEQLASYIAGSPEYYAVRAGGTNLGFLDALFADGLHRGIDPDTRTSMRALLVSGYSTLQIASAVFNSAEHAQVFVTDSYRRLLGRNPDSGGLANFSSALQNGLRDEELIAILASSGEYFAAVNGMSPNVVFVTQAYHDLLGRLPDSGGMATFSGPLDQNLWPRSQVVASITGSDEYRARVVANLYQTLLHRPADPAGASSFVSFLGSGGTVEQAQALIAGSAEYFQTRGLGTTDGFLDALYTDALGRPVDPTGRRDLTQMLNSGATTTQAAANVFASAEYFNRLVNGFYTQFLRRPADPSGLNSFVVALQQGARDEQVIAALMGSVEVWAAGWVQIDPLSTGSLMPGALLTITGTGFTPTAHLSVRFFTESGYSVTAPVMKADPGSLLVAIPPFIDPATGEFAAGAVRVQVVKEENGKTAMATASTMLQIQDLPTPAAAPGTALSLYFQAGLNYVQQLQSGIQGTSMDTPALDAALAAQGANLQTLLANVQSVVQGQTQSFTLGTVDGSTVVIGARELMQVERLLMGSLLAQAQALAPYEIPTSKIGPESADAGSSLSQQALTLEQAIGSDNPPNLAAFTGYYNATLTSPALQITQAARAAAQVFAANGAIGIGNLMLLGTPAAAKSLSGAALLYAKSVLTDALIEVGIAIYQTTEDARSLLQSEVRAIENSLRVYGLKEVILTFLEEAADELGQIAASGYEMWQAKTAQPTIEVSPTSLSFSMSPGGLLPPGREFLVTNWGPAGSVLDYTLESNQTWLGVSTPGYVAAGATGDEVAFLQGSAQSLPIGEYDAVVTVADAHAPNQRAVLPVHLTVTPLAPAVTVSPATLEFYATQGGPSPGIQAVTVTNSGESGSLLTCSVSDNAAWLTVSGAIANVPKGGSGTLQVFANSLGLSAGTYTATITISSGTALNPPQTVTVTLRVTGVDLSNLTGTWTGSYNLTVLSPYDGSPATQSGQLTLWLTENPNHTLTGSVQMLGIVVFYSTGGYHVVNGIGSVTGTVTRTGSSVQVDGTMSIPTDFGTFGASYRLFSWADGSLDGYFLTSNGTPTGNIHVSR